MFKDYHRLPNDLRATDAQPVAYGSRMPMQIATPKKLPWTDERIELLKVLWADGMSASQMAARLGGISRNAVLGKVHRLGLPLRELPKYRLTCAPQKRATPLSPMRRHKTRADGEPLAPKFSVMPLPPEQQRPAKLMAFVDLTDKSCRFSYGDPKTKDFGFCGCETAPGSSYCPGHHAICWNAPAPEKRLERKSYAFRRRIGNGRLAEFAS
jgi:GcrA cell cycle regulator